MALVDHHTPLGLAHLGSPTPAPRERGLAYAKCTIIRMR
jgi:hypothetical protein